MVMVMDYTVNKVNEDRSFERSLFVRLNQRIVVKGVIYIRKEELRD